MHAGLSLATVERRGIEPLTPCLQSRAMLLTLHTLA